MILNRKQREALANVYRRPLDSDTGPKTLKGYRAFRRTVQFGHNCAMVHWCGMWLGIEEDGYTHS